jgi:hypothetical protein
MTQKVNDLDRHADLVPHFATRAEIAELREKIMSLQTIVRALAARQGADGDKLQEWALTVAQFNSEPGRALAKAQEAAEHIIDTPRGGGGRTMRQAANAPG